MRHALLFFALCLTACPGEPVTPPPPPPAPAPAPKTVLPEPRDDGRLPALATPVSYQIDLTIDPNQPRFSGSEQIELDVPQRTSWLVLHAHGLEVAWARASWGPPGTRAAHPAKAAMRVAKGASTPEELVLAFDEVLPAGHIFLEIAWAGPFDDELSGLYRVKDGQRWYAFTQFEATDARRAFPCFDEPAFKTPVTVRITTPPDMIAVANTPETKRGTVAKTNSNVFEFAPTPPVPSYLVAFAVGDFDLQSSGRVRLVSTKGKPKNHGDLALEATNGLLQTLEEYFGIPYPYAKLDIVAVPDFAAGAMENPGLVTFREERLLLDPQRASIAARRSQAMVIAHELGHQWFGDLVTAAWWNDLWLNEGMATWIEWHAVDRWRPSYGAKNDSVSWSLDVMDLDSLQTARAIRQPVTTTSEANEAFDGITYEKGAAVLGTIEHWIGDDTFRKAIHAYLDENKWKSVQADKLLAALDRWSGKDVSQMASSYLDKAGVPVVDAHLECEAGGRWHAELSQEPWRPLGVVAKDPDDRVWTIPVCVRAPNDAKGEACADLAFGAPSIVAGRGKCPAAIHPNTESAYYRYVVSDKQVLELAKSKKDFDVPARISLLSNAWAGVRAGKLDPKTIVKLLPMFDDDPERHVVEQVVAILGGMDHALVDEEARPAFRKAVAARLAKRKKDLGWLPSANEQGGSGDEALLRHMILPAMADFAEDETTLKEADDFAQKWISDQTSIDADAAAIAVDLGSRRATEARLTALRDVAKKAKNREDRVTAIRGMYGFDDPAILGKALQIALTDEISMSEMRHVFRAVFGRRKAQAIAEPWIRAHWDDLRKKLPGSLSSGLVRGASVGCTKAEVDDSSAFYTPRAAAIEGATRGLAESLEVATLCAELRRYGASTVGKALAGK